MRSSINGSGRVGGPASTSPVKASKKPSWQGQWNFCVVRLVQHRAREMGADIAIGDQPLARQIDQNALPILIGIVEDAPLILRQFAHPRHRDDVLAAGSRSQAAHSRQRGGRHEKRAAARHQKAQGIAPRHQIIGAPAIGELFAPLLAADETAQSPGGCAGATGARGLLRRDFFRRPLWRHWLARRRRGHHAYQP